MKASKFGTNLAVLGCLGALVASGCGEDECEASLSCIERDRVSQGGPDASAAGADSGTAVADGSVGNAGSSDGSVPGNGGGGAGGSDGTGGQGGEGTGGAPETDGGPDGGDVEPPPVCGVNPIAGCVASTQNAVFVSAGVDESGDGSQESPVKTILEGVELARDQDASRIVVCNGVYEEAVSLTVDDSGRSLTGGYNCDSWLYNPDGETLVRPTARGYALQIEGTTQRVTISNFTFDAMAAMDPGESSIAAFVVNASDVRLKQVHLIAHEGVSADPSDLLEFVAGATWPADDDLDGNASDPMIQYSDALPPFVDRGGPATTALCAATGESTTGGRGGDYPYRDFVGAAIVGAAGLPVGKGGAGGFSSSPQSIGSGCDVTTPAPRCTCTPVAGRHGQAGDMGDDGAGASAPGEVSSGGWLSQAGEAGAVGHPGGGGGGGDGVWHESSNAGYYGGWAGGGGGAAGGCGGNGGTPGAGGGASIALLILDSLVALDASELVAANAGDGGAGSGGQAGQSGGTGGAAPPIGDAYPCAGGNGGQGGSGGAAGGGAGGVSTGIVWAGDFEPTVDAETVITLGDPGVGGGGGDPGNNDGVDGVAQEVLEAASG